MKFQENNLNFLQHMMKYEKEENYNLRKRETKQTTDTIEE